ncbi:MAG: MAE_28990/MAE_18760 family HEPN-like nuclease [Vampirovibrionales bacterium]|nr:MAE_28990/MAE_18760 family HEPN-like nuclease [Vampirovibrionales bacterium]
MAITITKKGLLEEVSSAENGAYSYILSLLSKDFSNPLEQLLTIPFLYSVWEKTFKDCTSITYKGLICKLKKIEDCPLEIKTLIYRTDKTFSANMQLQKDILELVINAYKINEDKGFNHALIRKNSIYTSSKALLSGVMELDNKVIPSDFTSLPIIFKNVNTEVVILNMDVAGIDSTAFTTKHRGNLDRLLSLRQNIAHGNSFQPVGESQTQELITFTNELISDFCKLIKQKIRSIPFR